MAVKIISNTKEKKLRKNIASLKSKLANELSSKDKDAIIIYLAKKFNLIKKVKGKNNGKI